MTALNCNVNGPQPPRSFDATARADAGVQRSAVRKPLRREIRYTPKTLNVAAGNIELTLDAATGTLVIDGIEQSRNWTDVHIIAKLGQPPQVTVTYLAAVPDQAKED